MQKGKRIVIATIVGLICGFICFGLASSGSQKLPGIIALQIIISRTFIGFAIGISSLKMKYWAIHGLVMGFIFSIPAGIGALSGPDNPEFSKNMILISTIIMGMIYGVIIELVTSVVFKARVEA